MGRKVKKLLARAAFPLLHLMPLNSAHRLKRRLLSMHGIKIAVDVEISPGLTILNGENLRIQRGATLGFYFSVYDVSTIDIGEGVLVSHNVTFISGTHLADRERTSVPGPITVGRNVWIGAGVTIVGPCTIGDDVVIGAHSYVTGDLQANCIYAGAPARLVRRLDTATA